MVFLNLYVRYSSGHCIIEYLPILLLTEEENCTYFYGRHRYTGEDNP